MEKTFKHVSTAVPKLLAPLQDTFLNLKLSFNNHLLYISLLFRGKIKDKKLLSMFLSFLRRF